MRNKWVDVFEIDAWLVYIVDAEKSRSIQKVDDGCVYCRGLVFWLYNTDSYLLAKKGIIA